MYLSCSAFFIFLVRNLFFPDGTQYCVTLVPKGPLALEDNHAFDLVNAFGTT